MVPSSQRGVSVISLDELSKESLKKQESNALLEVQRLIRTVAFSPSKAHKAELKAWQEELAAIRQVLRVKETLVEEEETLLQWDELTH